MAAITFSTRWHARHFLKRSRRLYRTFVLSIGAREYLHDGGRWILALHDARPDVLARLPLVRERIAAVRAFREASKSAPTQKLATTPTLYHVNVLPGAPFLVIPEVSSGRREYAPIGWLEPPVIPSNLVRILTNATSTDFALLTSSMHMAWLRHIGGRLKSDYRYSIGLVYNTFPVPPASSDWSKLEPLAQAVLEARAAHPSATLADLYDPELMPPDLRRAHHALDRVVDRLYRRSGFSSERERVEHLFMLYEKMRTPLGARTKGSSKKRRTPRSARRTSPASWDSRHSPRMLQRYSEDRLTPKTWRCQAGVGGVAGSSLGGGSAPSAMDRQAVLCQASTAGGTVAEAHMDHRQRMRIDSKPNSP